MRAIAFFAPDTGPQSFAQLHPGDVGELLKRLAQGASHGLIEPSELPTLLDEAAYNGAQNDDFILQLCADRHHDYQPRQWQTGPEAEAIMEELAMLKTFERANFLAPPTRNPRRRWMWTTPRRRRTLRHCNGCSPELHPMRSSPSSVGSPATLRPRWRC